MNGGPPPPRPPWAWPLFNVTSVLLGHSIAWFPVLITCKRGSLVTWQNVEVDKVSVIKPKFPPPRPDVVWRLSAENPLPFYIPFLTEKLQLSYTFFWQMVPLSHVLHPIFTAVNILSLKDVNKLQTRTFSRLFWSHKMHLLVLLRLFTHCNGRSPSPFIYFN